MKYLLKSLTHVLPVVVFFVLKKIFEADEIISTILMILVFVSYLYFTGFKRRELELLIMGCIIGFMLEVVLGAVYREQFWVNASLFGVPIWLPLAWGMGFVIIRRLGDIIVLHRKKI
ncbi:MAG: hypothetical protein Q8R29_03950 [bacterium]|nr:hypothetical protein [bacterium]